MLELYMIINILKFGNFYYSNTGFIRDEEPEQTSIYDKKLVFHYEDLLSLLIN